MVRLLLASLSLVVVSRAALAAPEVVLPVSGLVMDGRATSSLTFEVSSTWSIDDDESSFQGRDIVTARDGDTSTTTWLSIGWFDSGDCLEVLAAAPLDADWMRLDVALWGERWQVRGGVVRDGHVHAGRSAVMLCRTRGERKAIILTHFFDVARKVEGERKVLSELGRALVPSRMQASLRLQRTAATAPTTRPDVTNEGNVAAVRSVVMPWAEMTVRLPGDGSVWLSGADLNGVDLFERMAPALPELSLVVARLEVPLACDEALASIRGDKLARPPAGLPNGWTAGPTKVSGKYRAIGACRRFAWGLLIVGIASTSKALDVGGAAPLLDAIAAAADAPRAEAGSTANLPRDILTPRRAIAGGPTNALSTPPR